MPAERSISPPIINMISPLAMIAAGATNCDRFCRLAPVSRKSALALSKCDQDQRHDKDAGFRRSDQAACRERRNGSHRGMLARVRSSRDGTHARHDGG